MRLRLLSYLAPSLPAELFEALGRYLAEHLGVGVDVDFDTTRSGPRPGESEPFSTGEVDLAFVCASSYVWMTAGPVAPVRLVGAAWLPTDPRSAGLAVYFGDVLAPVDGAATLDELVGARVAYNDDVSLSGFHSLRLAMLDRDVEVDRVDFVRSGSHLRSLELLVAGEVDAAAIDSNVWRRRRREAPVLERRLCTIAELGPHPVQPLVARSGLPASVSDRIRMALLELPDDLSTVMAHAELSAFGTITDVDYDDLRHSFAALGLDRIAR